MPYNVIQSAAIQVTPPNKIENSAVERKRENLSTFAHITRTVDYSAHTVISSDTLKLNAITIHTLQKLATEHLFCINYRTHLFKMQPLETTF